jgi:hypothetical protein
MPPDNNFTETTLDHDAIKWNRNMISSPCLSMISAQTRFRVCRLRETRFPLCANAALRVRIMLWRIAQAYSATLARQAIMESVKCDAAEKRSKQGERDIHAEIFGSSR